MSWFCLSYNAFLLLLISSSNFNFVQSNYTVDNKLEFISNTLLKLVNEFETINKRLTIIESSLIASRIIANSQDEIRGISEEIKKFNYNLAGQRLLALKNNDLIPDIVHETYRPGNVDIILEFAESLQNMETKVLVLCALQTEMHANGNKNPFKLISLAKLLDYSELGVRTETVKKKQETAMKNLIVDIKDGSTRFLESAMIAQNYNQNEDVERLANALFQFRVDVSNAVIDQLVDAAFGVVSADNILENVSSHKRISQAATGLLSVFNRFNYAGNLNDEATLILTAHLRQLQLRSDYSLLDQYLLNETEKVIQNLPTCARNLLFSSKICLWNKGRRRYLQASTLAEKYDKDRRNIFMVQAFDVKEGATWNVGKIGRDFYLKSINYKEEYLYAAYDYVKGSKYVFNWIPGNNTDGQSAWNFELDGDYCYVKSCYYNQYLYASDVKYDLMKNYAFIWSAGIPVKTSEFQWQVRNCDDSVPL